MSIDAKAERLRTLTDDFYHGLLDWDGYRHQRGELLDALLLDEADDAVGSSDADQGGQLDRNDTSGEQTTRRRHELEVGDADEGETDDVASEPSALPDVPDAPDAPDASDEPAAADPPEAPVVPAEPERKPGLDRRYLPYVGGGAALVLAVLIWALWPAVEPAGTRETPSNPVLAESAGSAVPREFVSAGRWDDEAVSGFMLDWDGLSRGQREAVRDTEQFRIFVAEVIARGVTGGRICAWF